MLLIQVMFRPEWSREVIVSCLCFCLKPQAKFKVHVNEKNKYVLALLALVVSSPTWWHTTLIPSVMTYMARQRLRLGVAGSSPVAVEQ